MRQLWAQRTQKWIPMHNDEDFRPPNGVCSLPLKMQQCLIEIFGENVIDVAVIINRRKLAWHFWPGVKGATTRRGKIFINFPCGQFWGDPEFVLHEYYHVIQHWGVERMTILRYVLRFWIKEREAREFARVNVDKLQRCLGRQTESTGVASRPLDSLGERVI